MSVNIHNALVVAAAVVLSIPSASAAYDFVADGIYYKITDSIANEVDVTYESYYAHSSPSYSGAIIIPDSVVYGDVTYAVTAIGECAFYSCGSLTSVEMPGVTAIGEYAFCFCESLTSVEIPAGVESIEHSAFGACSGLKSVSFSENSKLSTIGDHAFYCTSLTAVTIPSGVTTIGSHAFFNCTSLAAVTILSSVTTIGDYAFDGCESLTSVEMPGVTAIGDYAFFYCTSLASVEIPAGVESIEDYTFAFSGLKSVSFSENSKLSTIGECAFIHCTSLAAVTIPSSVTTISDNAFSQCTSLAAVTMPSSVTTIGDYAFYYCTSLAAVTIPSSVTTIGDYAFYRCDSLVDVYSINPTPPYAYGYSFGRTTYRTGTLHVPATAVEIYASTYPWSNFTNIEGDAESGIHSGEADATEPAITARDGAIEVSGIDGGTVNVYSTSGALVATGEASGSAINVPGNGIYIVRINAGDYEIARKVAVR